MIVYDPYCKKINALTISTPVGIDCRDYYAIELVYLYSCLGLFDWHGVHVGWMRRAASPSHLTARRPGFSNVVKGTCAIFLFSLVLCFRIPLWARKTCPGNRDGMRLAPLGPSGLESQAASRLVIHGTRYRVTG